jgi:signal transduction histidine kinase
MAERKKGFVEIAISDNGWGIPDKDIPQITERFYRGRHGETTRGTGLGLSIYYEIMRIHGGGMKISSCSKEGEGTRIVLNIPVSEV